jgi:hypothetical protein
VCEYREWYIIIDSEEGEGHAYIDPCANTHHAEVRVIEYKAYQALEEFLEAHAKQQNEAIKSLQSQLSAKEAEIAELSKNCISLSLHESRVWALEEQLAKSDLEVVKLREAIGIANAAISVAANRKECKGWSCCSSCGPIYECEEAQEKIKLLIEGENI